MEAGTYTARALEGVVWETNKGALMITFLFVTEDHQRIKGGQCLVQKDGTVSEITMRTLKECFGWDGQDPFWLTEPANLEGKDVELVVEMRSFVGDDGQTREAPSVRYINPVGGSDRMPESASRSSILSKYGAKFRALSGGAPAAKPKKVAKPAPAPKPAGPTSTMEECWGILCGNMDGKTAEEMESAWFAVIERLFPGKNNSDLTPQDWGKVKAEVEDNVPM